MQAPPAPLRFSANSGKMCYLYHRRRGFSPKGDDVGLKKELKDIIFFEDQMMNVLPQTTQHDSLIILRIGVEGSCSFSLSLPIESYLSDFQSEVATILGIHELCQQILPLVLRIISRWREFGYSTLQDTCQTNSIISLSLN